MSYSPSKLPMPNTLILLHNIFFVIFYFTCAFNLNVIFPLVSFPIIHLRNAYLLKFSIREEDF